MSSLKEVKKYEDLTFGQWKALATKCGGLENVLAILQEEKALKVEEILLKLFDKNNRRIPKDLKSSACDASKNFYLVQSGLETIYDYADRLVRFQKAFREGPIMSAAEFEGRAKGLIAEIENNKNLCNLLNGIYLPIILLKLENFIDYGKTLEEIFLPAVKYAYEKQFPGRKFNNYRENDLVGKVSIVSGSRHEKLVEKMMRDYTIVIYFPNPLQGFSVLASREQMATLPESLILAGGFDTASAMAMYPDVLARDWYTPVYDLSALAWQSPDYSLNFEARDDGLDFYYRGLLGDANDFYFSGLLFLGSA